MRRNYALMGKQNNKKKKHEAPLLLLNYHITVNG